MNELLEAKLRVKLAEAIDKVVCEAIEEAEFQDVWWPDNFELMMADGAMAVLRGVCAASKKAIQEGEPAS